MTVGRADADVGDQNGSTAGKCEGDTEEKDAEDMDDGDECVVGRGRAGAAGRREASSV